MLTSTQAHPSTDAQTSLCVEYMSLAGSVNHIVAYIVADVKERSRGTPGNPRQRPGLGGSEYGGLVLDDQAETDGSDAGLWLRGHSVPR